PGAWGSRDSGAGAVGGGGASSSAMAASSRRDRGWCSNPGTARRSAMRRSLSRTAMSLIGAPPCPRAAPLSSRRGSTGPRQVVRHARPMHLDAREVDIWHPPGYDADAARRFPVLYMHDGQNLFDPAESDSGKAWRVDEVVTRLSAEGRAREAIVVGVWSSARRRQDYMPRAPVQGHDPAGGDGAPPAAKLSSDAYVAFLVDELKPSIDAQYR